MSDCRAGSSINGLNETKKQFQIGDESFSKSFLDFGHLSNKLAISHLGQI